MILFSISSSILLYSTSIYLYLAIFRYNIHPFITLSVLLLLHYFSTQPALFLPSFPPPLTPPPSPSPPSFLLLLLLLLHLLLLLLLYLLLLLPSSYFSSSSSHSPSSFPLSLSTSFPLSSSSLFPFSTLPHHKISETRWSLRGSSCHPSCS